MAKTKKKPAPKKADRFSTQANLEAFVRYGGQLGELARMARDTKADAEVRARDSIAAGDAIAQSAKTATPELQRIYDSSLGEMAKRKGIMESQLSGLGQAANPYRAGGLFASTNTENRTSGEKASALRELVGRRQDAISGARFGAQQARQQGDSDVAKIREKMLDVQAESGAYQAGRIGDLTEAERKRATQVQMNREDNAQADRNSRRSANVQREKTAAQLAKEKRNKGPKLQTADKHTSVRSEIDRAIAAAKQIKATGQSRSIAAQYLTSDRPSKSSTDTAGNTVNTPGRKANDELTASVALDLAYDGHISRRNVQRLHDQRFSLKTLGLADRTGGGKKPKPRSKSGKPVSTVSVPARPFG